MSYPEDTTSVRYWDFPYQDRTGVPHLTSLFELGRLRTENLQAALQVVGDYFKLFRR